MPITDEQKSLAERQQWAIAKDGAQQIRLVAGPGTGKTYTIEKRVAHLLNNGANPKNLYVISFTRATCMELRDRIKSFCSNLDCASQSTLVNVSTMHSLALSILRRANLLNSYPSSPIILDDWEQLKIYDRELADSLSCTPSRAEEIRLAHDAQWQTLNSQYVNQARITSAEVAGFNAFHSARTNLYCCVLPGEVIHKCVEALQQGSLDADQLPQMDHLIVDEFQDLNACDQEFINLLSQMSPVLFVAGDDDQSIYSFRHADPNGIIQFELNYPESVTHVLTDCFRCTPNILNAAAKLITYNPNRLQKNMVSLYGSAHPPIQGIIKVWSFNSAQIEADAIAQSCERLIKTGLSGREDEILILISSRKQLSSLTEALRSLGLPFEPPRGKMPKDELDSIRAIYSILRIIEDNLTGEHNYLAHRDLLEVLYGVGAATCRNIANLCIAKNQNFRQLFYLAASPEWLKGLSQTAVQRIKAIIQVVSVWEISDTLAARSTDISSILSSQVFITDASAQKQIVHWNGLINKLPPGMTLGELLNYLEADSEPEQQKIIDIANQRLSILPSTSPIEPQKRIRILTMHGAKGLSGKIVFIPGAEQGLIPNFKALGATGLLIEQRRLFYVSITRSMACCIISHATQRSGHQAMTLTQRPMTRLNRSQFLNEMGVPSEARQAGLTQSEANSIIRDISLL
jgi:DNA helicase-2/ATP-dependent DNA helicase PcrA